jgi:hypothetical protein
MLNRATLSQYIAFLASSRTGPAAAPLHVVCSLKVRVFCDSIFCVVPSCPNQYFHCLVSSRQVTEVPVDQFASDLGFRNVDQILQIRISI